jgi:hypothetical protein
MAYKGAEKLNRQQRLAHKEAMLTVGNPDLHLGRLSDAVGDVGRLRVRALRPFRGAGLDVTPGMTVSLPRDIAQGLAMTGFAEVLSE